MAQCSKGIQERAKQYQLQHTLYGAFQKGLLAGTFNNFGGNTESCRGLFFEPGEQTWVRHNQKGALHWNEKHKMWTSVLSIDKWLEKNEEVKDPVDYVRLYGVLPPVNLGGWDPILYEEPITENVQAWLDQGFTKQQALQIELEFKQRIKDAITLYENDR